MLLFAALCLSGLFAAACSGKDDSKTKTEITTADLAGHNFVLSAVDGKAFVGEAPLPHIAFDEDMKMSGAVCNRFIGQGELSGNILRVDPMGSTRMLCPGADLDKLEQTFSALLTQGATATLDGDKLVLAGEQHSLEFKRADQAQ